MSEFDRSEFDHGEVFGQDPMMMTDPALDPMMDPTLMDPMLPPPPPSDAIYVDPVAPPPPPGDVPLPGSSPELMAPLNQLPMSRMQAWMERDIYLVIFEEILIYRRDLKPEQAPRADIDTGRDFPKLFEDLRSIMIDKTLEPEREALIADRKAWDTHLAAIEPFKQRETLILNERAPIASTLIKTRKVKSELQGYLANISRGYPVAQWLIDKYGDGQTATQTLADVEAKIHSLEDQLLAVQARADQVSAEISARNLEYLKAHKDLHGILEGYRKLILAYLQRNPEMGFRLLKKEIENFAKKQEIKIAGLVKQRELDVQSQKGLFERFFQVKSDEFITKNGLDESLVFAKYQVYWRTVFLREGKKIIGEIQADLSAQGKKLQEEGDYLSNLSDAYKLTHSTETQYRAKVLGEKADALKFRIETFQKMADIYSARAKVIKDELVKYTEQLDTIRNAYRNRVEEAQGESFKLKMVREFRGFQDFADRYEGVLPYIHQNYWEEAGPFRIAGTPNWLHRELDKLAYFLPTPAEYFQSGLPLRWPDGNTVFSLSGYEWVDQKRNEIRTRLKNELDSQMKYKLRERTHKITDLLDLYLAPDNFRQNALKEAAAKGFVAKRPNPISKQISDIQFIVKDRNRRYQVIVARLQDQLSEDVGVKVEDFTNMPLATKLRYYKQGKVFLAAAAPRMKKLHAEMLKLRPSIRSGMASQKESLAYVEALRVLRKFAYWSQVVNELKSFGEAWTIGKEGLSA